MKLININQIPRSVTREGCEEVYTDGFGCYYIHIYTKGTRRYFELHGWYTGMDYFSCSIKDDRDEALAQVRVIADNRVNRYKKAMKED